MLSRVGREGLRGVPTGVRGSAVPGLLLPPGPEPDAGTRRSPRAMSKRRCGDVLYPDEGIRRVRGN